MIVYLGIAWFRVTSAPLAAIEWDDVGNGWARLLRRSLFGGFLSPSVRSRAVTPTTVTKQPDPAGIG